MRKLKLTDNKGCAQDNIANKEFVLMNLEPISLTNAIYCSNYPLSSFENLCVPEIFELKMGKVDKG